VQSALRPFYTKTPECLLILFDLQHPGAADRLRREEDAWCGFAHVERLTEGHSALIIRPGGATRLAW
jgi:hypothetical protein